MKNADNRESFRSLYFIQLLVARAGKIHVVIQKITLSTHIVDCMICISMKNDVSQHIICYYSNRKAPLYLHRTKGKNAQSIQKRASLANNHISVDCVVIGFDGEQLKVLLVKHAGEDSGGICHDMKLPGSLIYMDRDLDEAAQRALYGLTGLRNVSLMQFKAFDSKDRTSNPKDVHWLERTMQSKARRIVTVTYLSMMKIDRALDRDLDNHQACWIALKDVITLAFDHNLIIKEAMTYVRQFVEFNLSIPFGLLPRKFIAAQLEVLFGLVYDKSMDVRNFHRKIAMTEYVVPLEEKQRGVTHRVTRYYKFDKEIYNKVRRQQVISHR